MSDSHFYIGPNVNITHSIIGNKNIIHQGSSIGQDGFGFAMSLEKHEKIPQVGRVIIGNNIEIGCNASIIGDIQIGNNVTIGVGSVVLEDIPDNSISIGNPAFYKEKR